MKSNYLSEKLRLVIPTLFIVLTLMGSYFYNQKKLYESIAVSFSKVEKLEYGNGNYKIEQFIDKVDGDIVAIKQDIDTTKIGKQELVFEVKKDDVSKLFKFEIEVEDTASPEITLQEDCIGFDVGTDYKVESNVISVVDKVDGNLEYSVEEKNNAYTIETDLDINVPGEYKAKIIAIDKNGNRSEKEYPIIVREKKPSVVYVNYNNNAVASGDTSSLVGKAYSLVGSPYVSGGNNPSGFDCSGFVQYVYSSVGISISRSTSTQITDGVAVSVESMQPGDIILWSSNGSTPTHSSLYVGDGLMIHATNPRQGVIVSNVNSWLRGSYSSIIGVRRI